MEKRKSTWPPPLERFNKSYKVIENGCWEWTGTINKGGYGIIGVNAKQCYAHRFSYAHFKGDLPEGFHVCHHCDNTRCVNPEHLFHGTSSDNARDREKKGRGAKPYTQKLTEEDVRYIRQSKETDNELAQKFGVREGTGNIHPMIDKRGSCLQ